MPLPEPTLSGLREGLSEALSELLDGYLIQAESNEQSEDSPHLLVETFKQLFEAMHSTEAGQHAGEPPGGEGVSELGEYALELFEQTLGWAERLKLPEVYQNLQLHTISMARWIAAHDGEIHSLEQVVDALARLANTSQEPDELLELYEAMGEITAATADIIRQDLEKTNPGRPWRVLHMNRAIVATRTHQPDAMDAAFQDLVKNLPEEASQFFTEGMEQMDLLNYPPHVREVMDRYYKKWSIDRSLH
ncbi:hypothetical protein MNBD_GAMMA15-294 [hydrothermal vent metagenome]|uniref:Uncharacterized protein n=1 Tax=hydrothermal vent metagenome TaxID=652676 RepID=A0A3B0ZCW7_9ZZZZ